MTRHPGEPEPGVYRLQGDGTRVLVHRYLDDGYELADVHELLGVGAPEAGGAALVLAARELRLLRIEADARSFDHPAEFIEMCLDIARLEPGPGREPVRLVSIG